MANQQGFLADLSLDGLDITTNVQSTPLTRTKGTLNKAVQDNLGEMQSIPGMSSGTLNVTGWLDTDEHNALEVTWAKDVAVVLAGPAERQHTNRARDYAKHASRTRQRPQSVAKTHRIAVVCTVAGRRVVPICV